MSNQAGHAEAQPVQREFGHSPEVYASLITFISSIGVFGGAITFAVLFSIDCEESRVPKLLGYASALFLGSVVGCVPITVALHTQQDVVKELKSSPSGHRTITPPGHGRVKDPTLTFVRTQSALVSLLMVGAYCCMFLAIVYIGYGGPALAGFVLLGLNIAWSLLGYFQFPKSPVHIYWLQAFFVALVAFTCILFGAQDILKIDWTNHCSMGRKNAAIGF